MRIKTGLFIIVEPEVYVIQAITLLSYTIYTLLSLCCYRIQQFVVNEVTYNDESLCNAPIIVLVQIAIDIQCISETWLTNKWSNRTVLEQ